MSIRIERFSGGVRVTFPLHTENPNNGARGWSKNAAMARAREDKRRRETTKAVVLAVRPHPPFPVIVTVTRGAPSSGLDEWDGLGAALKRVIDGVADALGLPGDRDPRVEWRKKQRRTPSGVYEVTVEIVSAPSGTTDQPPRDRNSRKRKGSSPEAVARDIALVNESLCHPAGGTQ
ncbi:hypothetical protein AKJ09_09841 [Labilithrix luteola]|uniref:Uncharacterized protein n=1 Tax=Labilithrix luteola TaxID=1391654 RepID=A0A0K1QBR5_9BACT|nr:hypothetical protein [Labilithrix luteola]AKV03178.1 hypothetical protein AKJ09_09841 [Labilithrix luteola]